MQFLPKTYHRVSVAERDRTGYQEEKYDADTYYLELLNETFDLEHTLEEEVQPGTEERLVV